MQPLRQFKTFLFIKKECNIYSLIQITELIATRGVMTHNLCSFQILSRNQYRIKMDRSNGLLIWLSFTTLQMLLFKRTRFFQVLLIQAGKVDALKFLSIIKHHHSLTTQDCSTYSVIQLLFMVNSCGWVQIAKIYRLVQFILQFPTEIANNPQHTASIYIKFWSLNRGHNFLKLIWSLV